MTFKTRGQLESGAQAGGEDGTLAAVRTAHWPAVRTAHWPAEDGTLAGGEDTRAVDLENSVGGALATGGDVGSSVECAYVWGPIPSVAGVEDPAVDRGRTEKKRKRKSRWEAVSEDGKEGAKTSQALVLFPGEVVLSNGLKINLPVALTGRHESGRPELVKLYTDLAEVERQIRAGEFVGHAARAGAVPESAANIRRTWRASEYQGCAYEGKNGEDDGIC